MSRELRMTGACLFCGTLVLSLCGCNDSTSSNGEAAGGTTSQSGDADTATGQSGDADSAGTSGNDSNGGDTTSGSAGIEGDPCAALDLTFASTDCSDPSTCLPITCECTGTTASFGACSDDRCVDGLDCEILCALTPIQIDNCVRRVYGPIVECTSAAVCDDGPCVEALGVMLCGDRLACIVDEQCGYHCADGHCASDPLTACTNASECTWSCTDGQCTSGAAGSPCTDSAQCEANFCVDGRCSTGDVGEGCFADSNCRTDQCENDICTAVPVGGPCVREEDCIIQFCVEGVCSNGHRGSPCTDLSGCVGRCDETDLVCL